MERILVAEDDDSIRNELLRLLRAHGYDPVSEPPCDLALLDVNLPQQSGFSLCRKLKERFPSLPVIFLTARDNVEDELTGFGLGADDYIRKPFHASVLLARIARLLKRNENVFTVRELTLEPNALILRFRERETLLTRNEMLILNCLMLKPVCTRNDLVEELWEKGCYLDDNALYVNISRLRAKLKDLGADDYLQTVRGVGYRL